MTCEKCQLMREMGWPRPTCEECGRVEPTEENAFVWYVFVRYFPLRVVQNGFGGYALNVDGLELIMKEFGVEGRLEFIERMCLLVNVMFKQEEKEKDKADG